MEIRGFFEALAACLLVVQFIKLLWARRRFPAGPIPFPFIGSLWRVGWKIQQDTLMKLAKYYGNIFTLWIGHSPVVILSGFETVNRVLTDEPEALSGRPLIPFFKLLGKEKGIMFSNGKIWKQQRRFGHGTLQKLGKMKKSLEDHVRQEAQQLVEIFAQQKGQPLDASKPILHSVTKTICAAAFGYPVPIEEEALHELTAHISVISKFRGTLGEMIYNILPSFMDHIPGPHKKALSSCEFMRSFVRKEVENHKKDRTAHEPQDYVDFYLAQIKKEKMDSTTTFDEDNLVQGIVDLLVAGVDTLAATLSWALLFMVAHPNIQEKVQQELESALGPSRAIRYKEKKKLPYSNAVIHETQRLGNIVLFGVPRLCIRDMSVFGVFIPKGTLVVPDVCSVLLDPKQWKTPQQFNPNHFLDEDGQFMAREEFLPFGTGCRECPGQNFAQAVLFILFTSLTKTFTFRLPDGVKEANMEPAIGAVVHPHKFKLCAIPHSSAAYERPAGES